jgi:hypothetical protein
LGMDERQAGQEQEPCQQKTAAHDTSPLWDALKLRRSLVRERKNRVTHHRID